MDDASAKTSADYNYSFEEFRLIYQSTELVSDRKINFTRANSSLCLAIIAGQGIIGSWAYQKTDILPIAALTILVISLLGVVFCTYWNGQLMTFRDLNSAKFKVLDEMADHVVFPDYKERTIRSKNPFAREYQIMTEEKLLVKVRGRLVPRKNLSELIVPKSFLAFFILNALLCAFWLLRNYQLGVAHN